MRDALCCERHGLLALRPVGGLAACLCVCVCQGDNQQNSVDKA